MSFAKVPTVMMFLIIFLTSSIPPTFTPTETEAPSTTILTHCRLSTFCQNRFIRSVAPTTGRLRRSAYCPYPILASLPYLKTT